MTSPEPRPRKWHESLDSAWQAFLFVVLLTSPCWGWALIAWVTR